MPARNPPLITGEIYHVYNRGLDDRTTFTDEGGFRRALLTLEYYRPIVPPMRLSQFLSLDRENREKILKDIRQRERLVEVLSFCFMPNHFHLLLRQEVNDGISKFMSNFLNSYTRFFNTKHERVGQIFLRPFKAVRIYTEYQLLHVSRYIHLNPYSARIAKNLQELKNYPWSSLREYLGLVKNGLCGKETIFSNFKNADSYLEFVLDQADYQRELEGIKHLTLDA